MGSSSKSSRWLCVGVRRMGCKLRCRPHHLTVVYNYKIPRQYKQGDLADQGSMFTVCRCSYNVSRPLTQVSSRRLPGLYLTNTGLSLAPRQNQLSLQTVDRSQLNTRYRVSGSALSLKYPFCKMLFECLRCQPKLLQTPSQSFT
ncbi:UNVERIFIED_CONTAM: hypothetical protein NCL1_04025 [Trichonephila clavipes]